MRFCAQSEAENNKTRTHLADRDADLSLDRLDLFCALGRAILELGAVSVRVALVGLSNRLILVRADLDDDLLIAPALGLFGLLAGRLLRGSESDVFR
jgi:hypothetical protein